jgi:hypothetical protein
MAFSEKYGKALENSWKSRGLFWKSWESFGQIRKDLDLKAA